MDKNEFVRKLTINGIDIDVGKDDYGQCYFFEYKDENGNLKTESMGTYNIDYVKFCYYFFNPEYRALFKKDLYGDEMTEEEWSKYNSYLDEIKRIELEEEW